MLSTPFTSAQTHPFVVDPDETRLLHIVAPLIRMLILLKEETPKEDVSIVNHLLVESVNVFEHEARLAGVPIRHILATKYCLCTALDEAILSTAWGQEGSWDEVNLLGTFFKESFGGERFYIVLETMREDPETNANLLEVLYILLALGFKGKNYNKDPLLQKSILNDIQSHIKPYMHHTHDYLLEIKHVQRTPQSILRSTAGRSALLCLVLVLITLIFGAVRHQITQPMLTTLNAINTKMDVETKNRIIQ